MNKKYMFGFLVVVAIGAVGYFSNEDSKESGSSAEASSNVSASTAESRGNELGEKPEPDDYSKAVEPAPLQKAENKIASLEQSQIEEVYRDSQAAQAFDQMTEDASADHDSWGGTVAEVE